jgi:hypothetical protein
MTNTRPRRRINALARFAPLLPALAPLPLVACDAAPLEGEAAPALETTSPALRSGLDRDLTPNRAGVAETVAPFPIDLSPANGFFKEFGINGRTCGTCHDERHGWTITPELARSKAAGDPLFAFDGSDCLPPGVTNQDPRALSVQMLKFGNVRVEIPIPAGADFDLTTFTDPLGCGSPSAAGLRMYRRPLPSANSAFLATVMWDGRDTTHATIREDLLAQANGATTGHAQSAADLTDPDQQEIVNFELGTFHAQAKIGSLDLTKHGAKGGAEHLFRTVLPSFFIGINDPFLPGFTSRVFTIYEAWEPGRKPGAPNAAAAAIGRGEKIFNERSFAITNVGGLNGPHDASQAPIQGFCGVCHDTPNVGNHSVSLPIDIGISDPRPAGGLDVAQLPLYTFTQRGTGKTVTLTDPGRGLVTGRFADLGKFKGPNLRGLASRAPYFHNGGARDLAQVVEFYDQRFAIGLSAAEKRDLVAFLTAL